MKKNIETKPVLLLIALVFCATALLALQILLSVYTYKLLKHDLREEFLNEACTGVYKKEFAEFLQGNRDTLYQVLNKLESPKSNKMYENTLFSLSDVKRFRRSLKRFVLNLPGNIQIRSPTTPAALIGPYGLPGLPGPPGQLGPPGPHGLPGPHGPPGPPSPTSTIRLIGPPGAPGAPGPVGLTGPRGHPGLSGAKGETGHPGKDGVRGEGLKGNQGESGKPGLQGPKGDSGLIGLPGMQGERGVAGIKGDKGEVGSTGIQGEKGHKGDRGDHGLPGQPGFNGRDGQQGIKGEKGETGMEGPRGLQGALGAQGPIGPRGFAAGCNTNGDKVNHENDKIIIKKFGSIQYPGFDIQSTEHLLSSIGKPEFYGTADNIHSSWMIDSNPLNEIDSKKFWTTTADNFKLIEFNNAKALVANNPSTIYELDVGFDGYANIIYKGIFYYKTFRNKPVIIKYDFTNRRTQSLSFDNIITKETSHLYVSDINHFDFNVDENGLWIIFSTPESENTGVIKVEEDEMVIQNVWEINIKSKEYIDMFIASGILYTLEYSSSNKIKIGKAINLLSDKVSYVNLKGIQPSGGITMATFNHKHKVLLVVDDGKRLSYSLSWSDDDAIPTEVRPE